MGRLNSRRKGAVGEREWAEVLRRNGWEARRGQQFQGGSDSPDVVCPDLPIHWEVKRTERFLLYDAVAQAERDCGHRHPVVVHRRNGEDWVVILRPETLFCLLRVGSDDLQGQIFGLGTVPIE